MQNQIFQRVLVRTLGMKFFQISEIRNIFILMRLRISILIQIQILRFPALTMNTYICLNNTIIFFFQYVQLSCSKNRSMNALNSPFKTILKTFCRDKGDNPDPWRDPDPDPVLVQSCGSDWIRNTTVCEMEKNKALWNRNDLLLFRFRLWKGFGFWFRLRIQTKFSKDFKRKKFYTILPF